MRNIEVGEVFYSPNEELANTITHAIGALLAITGLAILVFFSGNLHWLKTISFIVYGLCLICGFAASALYHGLRDEKWKGIMRLVDHGCIFLLIAGTYTPFMLIIVKGWLGSAILITVWIMAIVGILLLFSKTELPQYASTVPYLVMGWLALFAIKPLYEYSIDFGWNMFSLLLAGGLFYSFGTFFYKRDEMAYNHPIWHLFVLAGSIFHFFAVFSYVVPHPL